MPYSKGYRPSLQALGATLAAARRKIPRTQADVARALRMSQASVSHIERGADTRVSTLVDLAREFGLEPMLIPRTMLDVVRAIVSPAEVQPEVPILRKFA